MTMFAANIAHTVALAAAAGGGGAARRRQEAVGQQRAGQAAAALLRARCWRARAFGGQPRGEPPARGAGA
jgi:hypothetical protein